MSDDLVPEEREQEYTRLLTVLRSSSQGPAPIPAEEQGQIIARVRERLARVTSPSTPPEVGTLSRQHHLSGRKGRTPAQFVAQLLAAVVVIGLILGSWVLFRGHQSSHGTAPATPTAGTGPTAQAQSDGLEASLHVLIGGPYFLGELLSIDVSFTNHTQSRAELGGATPITNNSIANLCFPSSLLVQVAKGSDPSYPLLEIGFACTQPLIVTEVAPGQTITIHEYVPLTKSREVTLTRGEPFADPVDTAINGRWPAVHMQIQVNPQVPQDRALSVHNQDGRVLISVPAGAKVDLLYMESVSCDGYGLGGPNGWNWTPLSTNVLREPACPTAHRHWIYVVGAPGYAIVSGSRTS